MDSTAQAQIFKNEANENLKNHHFQKAIELYTKAIELTQSNQNRIPGTKASIYFANRAFAHIKMDNYGLAIPDAEQSVKQNPDYAKGYCRLALCKQLLQQFKDAFNAYKKAFELSGNKDAEIYDKMAMCKKESEEYLKNKKLTLLHDEKQRGTPVAKMYKNWREIEVESSYNGPRLEENEEPTSEWVQKLMEHYKNEKPLHKRYTLQLIEKCKQILQKYQSLVHLQIPAEQQLNVCGDIHGQYYDVLSLFKLNGIPSITNKYLFNGDFVDRGSFSVECIMTLIAWKCVHKDMMHMTRGNHQAKQVNVVYGFKGEVQHKFSGDAGVYEAFSEMFCALPLVYVINDRVMICHGGLPSFDGVRLEDIANINRFVEPPEKGLMCDLVWADPTPQNGRSPSKRGVSMGFGPDITNKFLDDNKLDMIIRSHQMKNDGYEETHNGRCITIFSAPNYCDFSGNKGAFIKLKGNEMKPKFVQFDAVPHPKVGCMAYANNYRGMM